MLMAQRCLPVARRSSWKKFTNLEGTHDAFQYFWITDSCPQSAQDLGLSPPAALHYPWVPRVGWLTLGGAYQRGIVRLS